MEFDFKAQWDIQAGRCITRNGIPYITIGRCPNTSPTKADQMARKIAEWLQGEALSQRLAEKGKPTESAAAKRASYLRGYLPGDHGYAAAKKEALRIWPDKDTITEAPTMPW